MESEPQLTKLFKSNVENSQEYACQCPANQRTEHRNPGIPPVGIAFSGDRKNTMRDAWAEIACRIQRVTRSPAKRQTDSPHQAPDQIRTNPGSDSCSGRSFRKNCSDRKNKHERRNDFAHDIGQNTSYRGMSTETGKLEPVIGRFLPVWEKMNPYHGGSQNCSEHLGGDIGQQSRKISRANRKTKRHCGVQVRITASASGGHEDTSHYGEGPPRGDDHPSGVLRLGFV